jgi:hypothetical protein
MASEGQDRPARKLLFLRVTSTSGCRGGTKQPADPRDTNGL